MILPAFLTLFVIGIFPFLFSLYASFTSLDLKTTQGLAFVGLGNYIATLQDPVWWVSLVATLEFVAAAVTIELVLGFLLALVLSQDIRGVGTVRSILTIPMAMAPVSVGLVLKIETNTQLGIWAYLMKTYLGYTFLPLSSTLNAMSFLILVDAWEWTPLCLLVFVACLRALPIDRFEAAKVDGASRLQMLRYITLPSLRYPLVVLLLLRTMDAFKLFDIVYVLTGGAPDHTTDVLSYYTYRFGMSYLLVGRASAMAYFVLVIVIVISNIYVTQIGKRV